MYERTLENSEPRDKQDTQPTLLEFGHEGLLYEQSFVMYDRGTDSLWVHVTGTAIKGPLRGRTLKFFPSILTPWKAWKSRFPKTLVLDGKTTGGFMGTFGGLDRKELGIVALEPGAVSLYQFEDFKTPIIHDSLGDVPILVLYAKESGIARVFERRYDEDVLEFDVVTNRSDGRLILQDRETESVWNGLDGSCKSGVYEGESLRPLVSYPMLINRFHAFFPEGKIYGKKKPESPREDSDQE